jgi:hypothetical protein
MFVAVTCLPRSWNDANLVDVNGDELNELIGVAPAALRAFRTLSGVAERSTVKRLLRERIASEGRVETHGSDYRLQLNDLHFIVTANNSKLAKQARSAQPYVAMSSESD